MKALTNAFMKLLFAFLNIW